MFLSVVNLFMLKAGAKQELSFHEPAHGLWGGFVEHLSPT